MLREIHARHGVRNFPCTRITIGGHEPLNRVAQDGKGREVCQVMHAALEIPDGFVADIHAVQGVRNGCSGILGNMDEQNPTFTHPVGAFKALGSGRIGMWSDARRSCTSLDILTRNIGCNSVCMDVSVPHLGDCDPAGPSRSLLRLDTCGVLINETK